ncbi:GDSL esterase/lipase CPRD49-like isoform X2 [Bidens hawaiensis]|uniref:GDSL esterase/lipase CPRD49-like isoform X2 n=1 Tax=Bidens hawaiensis TaxID=980011 RepID=UPI00404A6DE2
MVGPRRPEFVLFGSSIVQLSFGLNGWGAVLKTLYSRKADIFVRGYSGWNSRQALQDDPVHPSLAIVYFGGNDAAQHRSNGDNSHVPLSEYVENMRKIANHLTSLFENTRLIFLTAPPVNEPQLLQVLGSDDHTNELRQKYADALEELCLDMGIKVINLCSVFKLHPDWEETFFIDGMHFSEHGSQVVAKEILLVLKQADWKPSLWWQDMPSEFA